MFELLNQFPLLPLGLIFILLWKIRRVPFNQGYLSLLTSKYFKGWFALVVIFRHMSQRASSDFLFMPFTNAGYLAVAVFFFFSGFGSQKRYMTVPNYASTFLAKRLPAIFVPYLVASVCYIIVKLSCGEKVELYRLLFPWADGITLLPYAWFIFAIALFYIAFCGLMKWCKQNYETTFWGVLAYYILWTGFCFLLGYHRPWIISTAALPFGVLCAWKEEQLTCLLEKSYKCVLFATSLGIYLMIILFYWRKGFSIYVFDNINSILCVMAMLLFSAKFQIGNKALAFLGNIYLEVYLMQGIFISTVPMRQLRIALSNDFLWGLLVLTGTITSGYVLHKICQKPLQLYQQSRGLIS